MKRNEKMTAPRMLEAIYKRPGKPPRVKMIVGTREAIESLVGGPFDWTPLSSEDDGRENVAIYNTEAWRSGAPDNMYGIRGAFLVLGRDGEELCDVIDPRGVCPDAWRTEGRSIRDNPAGHGNGRRRREEWMIGKTMMIFTNCRASRAAAGCSCTKIF